MIAQLTSIQEAATVLLHEAEQAAQEIYTVNAPKGWHVFPAIIPLGQHKVSARNARVPRFEVGAKVTVLSTGAGFTYAVFGGATYATRDDARDALAAVIGKNHVIVCELCKKLSEPAHHRSTLCAGCKEGLERKLNERPAVTSVNRGRSIFGRSDARLD